MTETASSVFLPWSNFYIMTGSSAAALTGLMFVVITLVSSRRLRRSPDGLSTFSTPTVVHFCTALLVSAILSAPWRVLFEPAVLIAVAGLYGVGYLVRITLRARRMVAYNPDAEDWTWYTVLPVIAYGALFGGAIAVPASARTAMFALAAGVLLLMFIGIRNAWDIVTYITISAADEDEPPTSS